MAPAWRRARTDLRRGWAGPLFEFFDDGCLQRSAAISFYAFLSLFPLAILTVAVFGVVVSDDDARSRVIDAILSVVPLREDRGRRELRQVLEQVTSGAAGFGVFGVVGLVVSASGAMGAVRQGLNAVWDVEEGRSPVVGKLMDLGLVVVTGLTIVASVGVTVVIGVTSGLLAQVPGSTALPAAGATALGFVVVAGLYRLLPYQRVSWSDVWPGALVTAVAFEGLKWGFSVYLQHFARYSAVYDSLAAVTAFLIFLYVSAALLLLGGEVAARRTHQRLRADPSSA
ncbi:MAG TPA: YihY/virulence factor BrkB family protein [Baekduia sp.]|nr:YihY/virulence factor BrkB family protein [Baekduia sp.]